MHTYGWLILSICLIFVLPTVNAEYILVDHTAVEDFDAGNIPQYWIDKVKSDEMVFHWVGQSHSIQVAGFVTGTQMERGGLSMLEQMYPEYAVEIECMPQEFDESNVLKVLKTQYRWSIDRWSEIWNCYWGDQDYWANEFAREQTEVTHLELRELGITPTISGWGWSYDIIADGQALDESDNPVTFNDDTLASYLTAHERFNTNDSINDTLFIYATAVTDDRGGSNPSTYVGYRGWRVMYYNDLIRQEAQLKGGVLFDQADIENWNADNSEQRIDYWDDGGTLRTLYLRHTDYADDGDDCPHAEDALCIKKAKATWWMMARLAGWNGDPSHTGPTNCTDGATRQCGTSDVSVCSYGTETCSGGTWGSCVGAVNPTTEQCSNSLDDDCDGLTDQLDTVDCPTILPEGSYYVATTGSDTTGDGSELNPWATITHAAASIPIEGGTEIIVKDGMYQGRSYIDQQFEDWVTIRAENPYQAVLSNYNEPTGWQAALRVAGIPGNSNVIIEGFEITNDYPSTACSERANFVVLFSNMSNIIFRNNIVHDNIAPLSCNELLKVNKLGGGFPRNISINNNLFYNPAPVSGADIIDIMFIGEADVTENIFFSEGSGHASQSFITIKTQIDPSHPDYEPVRSPRFVVDKNVFLNWDGKTDQAFVQFGEDASAQYMITDSLIENNLLIGNSPNQLIAPFQLKGTRDIVVRANTIVGNYAGSLHGLRIRTEGSNPITENIYVDNNLFVDYTGTMSPTFSSTGGSVNVATLFMNNNLFWNAGNAIPSQGALNPTDDDANVVEGDPILESDQSSMQLPVWNQATDQFPSGSTTIRQEFERLINTYGAIGSGSAAINTANPANMPSEDILGNPRDGNPDIGAFELQNVSCTLLYDNNCDDCIQSGELIESVLGWYTNTISHTQLIANIQNWRMGC